jgi:hypothetical protein
MMSDAKSHAARSERDLSKTLAAVGVIELHMLWLEAVSARDEVIRRKLEFKSFKYP